MRVDLSSLRLIGLVICFLTACAAPSTVQTEQTQPASRYAGITAGKITPATDRYPPIMHADEWQKPYPIAGPVNSAGLEDSPFITPDGDTLFLFYTPSASEPAQKQIYDGVTGIYRAERVDGGWQEPERIQLAEKGQPALDGCPFFQDGSLWFCSIRDGNFRDIDFWSAENAGDDWIKVQNAGGLLNAEFAIGEMHISPDGRTMFFHRPDPAQGNSYDLWQAEYVDGDWVEPTPLDLLNTSEDDSRPALSPDGRELWFTRTYQGTPAIFRSVWSGNDWGLPELIISRFAGEPSIDSDGNIYFTHHFFESGRMIEADIYIAEKTQ